MRQPLPQRLRGPTTYLTTGRRFALHLTPEAHGAIVAVIDTLGHPLDAGPLAALGESELGRLRDDLTTLLGDAAAHGECPHCHDTEEVETATRRDPVTGAWDTETVRCGCTGGSDDEPPY
ncbi:MAG: hypothetical protein MSC31_15140 [Solirubrobacteraceae bacterium MAG38_C4-C5]|nr:hypothetical protein [Candidatus Siliceabacter maunaloa]